MLDRNGAKKWLVENGLVDPSTKEDLSLKQVNSIDFVKKATDATKNEVEVGKKELSVEALKWIEQYPRAAKKTAVRGFYAKRDEKFKIQIKAELKTLRQTLQNQDGNLTTKYVFKLFRDSLDELVNPEREVK